MVNTNKLRGRILEKGHTYRSMAWELRMSPATIGRKIKNETPMTLPEVEEWCRFLDIKEQEILTYFFVD